MWNVPTTRNKAINYTRIEQFFEDSTHATEMSIPVGISVQDESQMTAYVLLKCTTEVSGSVGGTDTVQKHQYS